MAQRTPRAPASSTHAQHAAKCQPLHAEYLALHTVYYNKWAIVPREESRALDVTQIVLFTRARAFSFFNGFANIDVNNLWNRKHWVQ